LSRLQLNLARRPFLNRGPVRRFVVTAWIVAALLLAFNVLLWLRDREDSTDLRARLADATGAIETRSQAILDSTERAESLGLSRQNAQVEFLNHKIAERTFPWSVLFDRIGAVLPHGVRLLNLSPAIEKRDARRRSNRSSRAEEEEELIDLNVMGEAKSDEAVYQLVDALFAHPAFTQPRLFREATELDGTVSFNFSVKYRPRLAEGTESQPEEEEPELSSRSAEEEESEPPPSLADESEDEIFSRVQEPQTAASVIFPEDFNEPEAVEEAE